MMDIDYGRDEAKLAGWAHLTALTGPLGPFLIWLAVRGEDPFAEREAQKALNFGLLLMIAIAASVAFQMFVPFIGFLGTVCLWACIAAALALCVQAFRTARTRTPATYPIYKEMVKL